MVNLGLFRHSETEELQPGNFLFQEGDPGDRMYVLIEGELEILVGSVIVETAGPGAVVGEMALIDKSARSAGARAKTICKLAPVDQRRFEFLIQHTPYFAIQVMEMMANRLRNTNRMLHTPQAS